MKRYHRNLKIGFWALIFVTFGLGFSLAYEVESSGDVKEFFKSVIFGQNEDVIYLSNQENGDRVFIEKEIYDEIGKYGKAKVIIYLSDEGIDFTNVELMKEQIRERQEIIFRALNNVKNNEVNNEFDFEEISYGIMGGDEVIGEDGDENIKKSDNLNEGLIINNEKNELIEGDVEDGFGKENFELIYRYEIVNGFAGEINKNGLEILSDSELVKEVYLDRILHTALAESTKLINADDVWRIHTQQNGVTGTNITGINQIVCVVDTGVDYTHPSLGGCLGPWCKVLDGYDFINNNTNPMDPFGHGTHVAGIVAGNGNVAGVAPDAKLLATRVCISPNNCPGSAMVAGTDWCVNQHLSNYDVDAITMSLGDSGEYTSANCPAWMNSALSRPALFGVPVTVASGNEGHNNGISYPACNVNVISVGAVYDANVGSQTWPTAQCTDSTTAADKVTCFSNTGSNLDVMAPGAMIYSTLTNGGYGNWGGTSMATPHIAGMIALMKQAKGQELINPGQIENLLKKNGKKVTDLNNGLNFTRSDAVDVVNEIVGERWGEDVRLSNSTGYSYAPSIAVDSQDNIHVVWSYYPVPTSAFNKLIYYKKLNRYGNVIINDTMISPVSSLSYSNWGDINPKIAIDLNDNIHIIWNYCGNGNSCHSLAYAKLNNSGSFLVNHTVMPNPSGTSRRDIYEFKSDSQGNLHLIISKKFFAIFQNYVAYLKLNNNGAILVNDYAIGPLASGASIAVDSQDKIHIAWSQRLNPHYNIAYVKLNNSGAILASNQITSLSYSGIGTTPFYARYPSVAVDSQNNVHISWSDNRNAYNPINVYYSKLNNNGSILISEKKLTSYNDDYSISTSKSVISHNNLHLFFSKNYATHYLKLDYEGDLLGFDNNLASLILPSVVADLYGDLHLALSSFPQDFYYKRSYPQTQTTLHGTPSGGNTVTLELQDEMNRNNPYVAGFSGGATMGITLPDGRNIPLNPDVLFTESVYNPSNLGISNSWGVLDNNGRANVTLALPNVSLSGLNIYGGFVTINATNPAFLGISDAVRVEFV